MPALFREGFSKPLHELTIRDFLTDGSIAGLCEELSRVTGAAIWLLDASGVAIIADPTAVLARKHAGADDDPKSGPRPPWAEVPESYARERALSAASAQDPSWYSEPIHSPIETSTGELGSIVASFPVRAAVPMNLAQHNQDVKRALDLLASSVVDVCEAQLNLRRRIRELEALYRLSSFIADADKEHQVLRVTLDLAMEVLGYDAGSISLVDNDSGLIVPVHTWGLSAEFLEQSAPLSRGSVFHHDALAGGVVHVKDLRLDERVADRALVQREGLVTLLTTGLLDRGKPIGVIRVYARTPRDLDSADADLLRSLAEHSAFAVSSLRLRSLRVEDERMQRQVKLAANVQRRMLPTSIPEIKTLDLAAHYAPSFELGGDFYDFIPLGSNLGILIGDVVGKGVAAALLMSAVRASFRAHAQDTYEISKILSSVNMSLERDTLDNEFATAWYGVYCPDTRRLTYCSAGHEWPLLVHVPEGRPVGPDDISRLTSDGMALGIDPAQEYRMGVVTLRPRDIVVAYTDGLHDAADFSGDRFGGTRVKKALIELLEGNPGATAQEITDHIVWHLRQFTGLAGRSDDVTLVVVRVTE